MSGQVPPEIIGLKKLQRPGYSVSHLAKLYSGAHKQVIIALVFKVVWLHKNVVTYVCAYTLAKTVSYVVAIELPFCNICTLFCHVTYMYLHSTDDLPHLIVSY